MGMHTGTLKDKYTLPRRAWEREKISVRPELVEGRVWFDKLTTNVVWGSTFNYTMTE